jgi:methionyl-tRNA formyltransferase
LGCVNVHASSLPRWRGAAPIQRAILSGDARAGVSIMRVVHDLDAGAYCRQADVEVGEKSCPQVMGELAELGARELLAALDQMADGTAVWVEQDESKVTYAKKIEKAEMLLDPAATALDNRRRVQTSLDAAPARMAVAGKGVRVLAARVAEEGVAQGEVLVRHGRVIAGCADGAIELLRVKPDGKREMEASAWAAGLHQSQLAWEHA